jgi:predicted aminopeptidase
MLFIQNQHKKRRRRRIWSIILLLLAIAVIWNWTFVKWGCQMAKGGLNVAFNTRPLADVLEDKTVPDSLKQRILLIAEIKKFGIDSLGLQDNPKVYKTLFDQKGKPLVRLLTVAERYELKAVPFFFPIVGSFNYKGFFDSTMLVQEEKVWKSKSYDTNLGQAGAYSTLGWLPEPILSSMLYYSDGDLADLILHEMTHGTIFVKGDHELSENLANFIGDYGALRFLKSKYGINSKQVKTYEERGVFYQKRVKHLNRGAAKLDSLYKTFNAQMPSNEKDTLKYHLIEKIVRSRDTLFKDLPNLTKPKFDKNKLPNNAFFVGFLTYNSKQNEFEILFDKKFKRNFPAFLSYMKNKYNQ